MYGPADALLVSLKADPVFALTIPGKLQSYLMAGIPIVGLLDGEGANVIRESRSGVVCPSGDGAGLASAIKGLASLSSRERAIMGENGQLYADREFERSELVARLEEWMKVLVLAK